MLLSFGTAVVLASSFGNWSIVWDEMRGSPVKKEGFKCCGAVTMNWH